MKTTVLTFAILVLASFSISAQEINPKPNSKWPFLFTEFTPSTIFHNDSNVSKVQANYNLLSQEIQFIDNGKIMAITTPEDILKVKFSGYTMVPFNKAFYVVLNDLDNNFNVYKKYKGNYSDIVETTKGAYGSSTSSSSVKQQSDVNIGGVTGMAIRQVENDKENGETFRVNDYYYYSINGNMLEPIKKRKLLKELGAAKSKTSKFIKSNKINLKKENDLIKLAHYINHN